MALAVTTPLSVPPVLVLIVFAFALLLLRIVVESDADRSQDMKVLDEFVILWAFACSSLEGSVADASLAACTSEDLEEEYYWDKFLPVVFEDQTVD